MKKLLYASSGVVPDVLVVVCFVGPPFRFFGAMVCMAVLWVMGTDVDVLPFPRFFGPSTDMSDIGVEVGACRLVGPDFGTFRPANAGCYFGKSVLIPCASQYV